mgnify:FL=1|jgi:hypothetical protein
MEVDLLIAVQDLIDRFFGWHFKYVLRLCERIDDLNVSAALG